MQRWHISACWNIHPSDIFSGGKQELSVFVSCAGFFRNKYTHNLSKSKELVSHSEYRPLHKLKLCCRCVSDPNTRSYLQVKGFRSHWKFLYKWIKFCETSDPIHSWVQSFNEMLLNKSIWWGLLKRFVQWINFPF